MKKLFIFATVCGVSAGVIYWIYKKIKSNITVSEPEDKQEDFKPVPQAEMITQNSNVMEEMYQAKSESAQNVYERHSEACEIMKDAYRNIMEDFVEDSFDEKDTPEKGEVKDIIIDDKSVSAMEEIELISDELDDLLK